MSLRTTLLLTAAIALFSSTNLLAASSGPVKPVPASKLEISSTSMHQPASAASCELKVKERYEYYDIDGPTVEDLQRQMRHNGTKWGDGNVYAALTTWDLHFDYDISEDDGHCSVKSVKTNVEIVYHLPRLVGGNAAELAPVWEKYLAHLKLHEFGHKDITVKTAGEINEVLSSLQNYKNEGELEKEAKRLTDEKLRELKDLQVGYDAKTHHGETQGAVLAAE
ncbi:DUF922 domain-containing Zn-dependent protease [Geomonas sp. Red32]|uniref:DUF922 domain-containing protein n=1 Tax=Geomonas sp. Red32 TaxID=2912856 RepID=UPI00202CEE0D|nr:DUF922 domain-containing protein [Geomonas sp. Red32]MCM0082419.1 DUF922 domain-containing Zn-dependent protease [Geomonas sp. Red32]